MDCLNRMDVVILAGGLGTRMRRARPGQPKALLPAGDRPIIDHLIDQVASHGARRVVLALGYLADRVEAHVKEIHESRIEVLSVVESIPMGTGGALRLAADRARKGPMLVMNGDSYVAADLCELVEFHFASAAVVSLLLVRVEDCSRFGSVRTDGSGAVTSFVEKGVGAGGPGYISAGVYVVGEQVVSEIAPGRPVSLETEVFPELVGSGLYAMSIDAPFLDIGTPESFREAEGFFAALAP